MINFKKLAVILIGSLTLSSCASYERYSSQRKLEKSYGGQENVDVTKLTDSQLCLMASNHFVKEYWSSNDETGKYRDEARRRKICKPFEKEQIELIKNRCEIITSKIYPPVMEERIEIRKRTLTGPEECVYERYITRNDIDGKRLETTCMVYKSNNQVINEPYKVVLDLNKTNRSNAYRICVADHKSKFSYGKQLDEEGFWSTNY